VSHSILSRTPASPLERFARALTSWAGSTSAFMGALTVIVLWGATGWIFDYSDTWQLVINTGTTIVTFLMVFLIQRSQNKDSLAVHLKLNELVAGMRGASNRIVNVEDLSEIELRALHAHYVRLAELAEHDATLLESHSVDEADARHEAKRARVPERRRERGTSETILVAATRPVDPRR
jgi:low affinity Fe/Cu permease